MLALMAENPVEDYIYPVVLACSERFVQCALDQDRDPQAWLQSAQADFNVWCTSIKANKPLTDRSSLDFRLRNFQNVREDICDLLRGLEHALQMCQDLLTDNLEEDIDSSPPPEEADLEDTFSDISPSSASWDTLSRESKGSKTPSKCDDDSLSPLMEHISYVRTILSRLMRISIAIRRSGNKYRFQEIDAACDENTFDELRRHLTAIILRGFQDKQAKELSTAEKILQAQNYDRLNVIQKRLIRANILRANRIQHMVQREVPRPVSQVVIQPKPSVEVKPTTHSIVSDTTSRQDARPKSEIVTSASGHSTKREASRAGSSVVAPTATDPGSNLDITPILRAKATSAITGLTRIGELQANIYPPCPKPTSDGLLKCPFCAEQLPPEISNEKLPNRWRAHVVQDVLPYSCIMPECDTPDEMYLTTERLNTHMIDKHSIIRWTCDLCNGNDASAVQLSGHEATQDPELGYFRSAAEWEAHYSKNHEDKGLIQERDVLAELNRRRVLLPFSCPLCEEDLPMTLQTQVHDHILRHLHEFSLLALPEEAWKNDHQPAKSSQAAGALSYIQTEVEGATKFKNKRVSYVELKTLANFLKSKSPLWDPVFAVNANQSALIQPHDSGDSALRAGLEFWHEKALCLYESLESVQVWFDTEDCRKVDNVCGHLSSDNISLHRLSEGFHIHAIRLNEALQHTSPRQLEDSDFQNSHRFIPAVPRSITLSERIREKIEDHLFYTPQAIVQPRVAISGPSVIINSCVASYVVREMLVDPEDQLTVFWINASDEDSIERSYRDLGREITWPTWNVNCTEIINYNLNWHYKGRWLLVLDGLNFASAEYLVLEKGIPLGRYGHLLITTTEEGCLELLRPLELFRAPDLGISEEEILKEMAATDATTSADPALERNVDETAEFGIENIDDTKSDIGGQKKDIIASQLDDDMLFLEDLDAAPSSLVDRLFDAMTVSTFHDPPRKYLPSSALQSLITVRSVEEELARIESVTNTDEIQKYGRNSRRELANWITSEASRVFSTTLQCYFDPRTFFLTMLMFRRYNFNDSCLPCPEPSSLEHRPLAFKHRVWSERQIFEFYEQQFAFLVPEFKSDQYNYNLHPNSIFPFQKLSGSPKAGAFSAVYKVRVHSDHHDRQDLDAVALKEVHAMRDENDEEAEKSWEQEAKALELMNNINHPHLMTCFAAIKKGVNRYFVFPWADGDSLREFWERTPKQNPSSKRIEEALVQLHGLADALSKLHNGEFGDGVTGAAMRHGDVKPENILRFFARGDAVGTLKLSDMGLATRHEVRTQERKRLTSSRYGTIQYEAPEAVTSKLGRSRLYDIWSMGCVTLEYIIWLLYGNDELQNFYEQLQGTSTTSAPYYEIVSSGASNRAVLHRVVKRWLDHLLQADPEGRKDTAIHDLLYVVQNNLLVVHLPMNRGSATTKVSPPLVDPKTPKLQHRVTADELRDCLARILRRARRKMYLFSRASRVAMKRPPTKSEIAVLYPAHRPNYQPYRPSYQPYALHVSYGTAPPNQSYMHSSRAYRGFNDPSQHGPVPVPVPVPVPLPTGDRRYRAPDRTYDRSRQLNPRTDFSYTRPYLSYSKPSLMTSNPYPRGYSIPIQPTSLPYGQSVNSSSNAVPKPVVISVPRRTHHSYARPGRGDYEPVLYAERNNYQLIRPGPVRQSDLDVAQYPYTSSADTQQHIHSSNRRNAYSRSAIYPIHHSSYSRTGEATGPEHLDTLTSMSDLPGELDSRRKHREAKRQADRQMMARNASQPRPSDLRAVEVPVQGQQSHAYPQPTPLPSRYPYSRPPINPVRSRASYSRLHQTPPVRPPSADAIHEEGTMHTLHAAAQNAARSIHKAVQPKSAKSPRARKSPKTIVHVEPSSSRSSRAPTNEVDAPNSKPVELEMKRAILDDGQNRYDIRM